MRSTGTNLFDLMMSLVVLVAGKKTAKENVDVELGEQAP